MSDDKTGERIARVEAKMEDESRRVKDLETNQRWAVITIVGLVLKTAFDTFVGKGL